MWHRFLLLFESWGKAHPRDVAARFGHSTIKNYWGRRIFSRDDSSDSTACITTAYCGLPVVLTASGPTEYRRQERRIPGTELSPQAQANALIDLVLHIYAPLPAFSLGLFARMLRYAAPQLHRELRVSMAKARRSLPHCKIGDSVWYLPKEDVVTAFSTDIPERASLLAPFDPVVWDRLRFEKFWGWTYRFEAYVPAASRKFGYYALPLLWRDQVIGWCNLKVVQGDLLHEFEYLAGGAPKGQIYKRALDAELERMRKFLRL